MIANGSVGKVGDVGNVPQGLASHGATNALLLCCSEEKAGPQSSWGYSLSGRDLLGLLPKMGIQQKADSISLRQRTTASDISISSNFLARFVQSQLYSLLRPRPVGLDSYPTLSLN